MSRKIEFETGYKRLQNKVIKAFPASNKRTRQIKLSTGIDELDEILDGGYYSGSLLTIAGGVSSGKTRLALQLFLSKQLKKSGKGLIVSFDEKETELEELAAELDFGTKPLFDVFYVPSLIKSPLKAFSDILNIIIDQKIAVIVINSLSPGLSRDLDNDIFIRYLIKTLKYIRADSFICCRADEAAKLPEIIKDLSDIIVFIDKIKKNDENSGTIEILKAAGIDFLHEKRQFEITDNGVKIGKLDAGLPSLPKKETLTVNISYEDINIDKIVKNKFEEQKEIYIKYVWKGQYKDDEDINKFLINNPEAGLGVAKINDIVGLSGKKALIPFAEKNEYDEIHDYYENIMEICSADGYLYGLPFRLQPRCMIYRKDLYEKYDLKIPGTLQELTERTEEIMKKEKIKYGFCFPQKRSEGRNFYINLMLNIMDSHEDINKEIIDVGGETSREAVKFMKDCLYGYKISGSNYPETEAEIINGFLKGEILSGYVSAFGNYLNEAENKPGLTGRIGFAPLPGKNMGNKKFSILEGMAYIVPKTARTVAYSKQFLEFLASPEITRIIFEKGSFVTLSGRKDINQELIKKRPYYENYGKILENTYFGSPLFYDNKLTVIMDELLTDILKKDPDEKKSMKEAAVKISYWKKTKKYDETIKRSQLFIKNNFKRKITVKDVAGSVGLSEFFFARLFKKSTGKTVLDYISGIRIENSKELLRSRSKSNITQVAYEAGFKNVIAFAIFFKKHTGYTPSEYRINESINK